MGEDPLNDGIGCLRDHFPWSSSPECAGRPRSGLCGVAWAQLAVKTVGWVTSMVRVARALAVSRSRSVSSRSGESVGSPRR
jgi:hypothetical protein